MPCNDITETIKLVLDSEGRIRSYTLQKRTCGGAVGSESLLIKILAGKSIDELLRMDEYDFAASNRSKSHLESFLKLKHLSSIKAALEAYSGEAAASIGERCVIAGIEHTLDGTVIDADINVGIIAENIKACAGCGPG